MNRTGRSRIPRWLLLAVVLGGLLLMHGLSVHGSHSVLPTTGAGAMATGEPAVDVLAMPGHEHVSMEIVCLAVLPVGLLLLLRRRGLRPGRRAAAAAVRGTTPVARSRSPDPPTPVLLSICRC